MEAIYIGVPLDYFLKDFKRVFGLVFPNLYQWFYPYVLEPIFPNQKESLSRVFKSDFLSFHYQFNLCFSHTYLSFPLLNSSYRRVVVRVVLGDQSVVITKVFILCN